MRTLALIDSKRRARDVVWKLIEGAGLEHCRLEESKDGASLTGVVVTVAEGIPTTIDYSVRLDRHWHTREATVQVVSPVHPGGRSLHLLSNGDGLWWRVLDGPEGPVQQSIASVHGCIDIDLAFTPATNTLPIRRFNLNVGTKTRVKAAWVQFPSLDIAVLSQQYAHFRRNTYRYESFNHGFHATVTCDDLGLVVGYQDLWERVAERDIELEPEESNDA